MAPAVATRYQAAKQRRSLSGFFTPIERHSMRILVLLSALLLSACGGGEVNCTAQGACTLNVGSVTTGPITTPSTPASGASAPSGGASSPVVTPIEAVPLARVKTIPPTATIYPGDLRWSAQGITYVAAVVTAADVAWVAVYSVPTVSATGAAGTQVAAFEVSLDDGLDSRGVLPTDESVRAYLQARIVPKLDAWMKANSSRWASGMVVYPVNAGDAPTGKGIDHVAARLAQWVEVKATGASLK